MLLPIVLLDAKSDGAPGDPVPLFEFNPHRSCFIELSSDFTGSNIDIDLEIANSKDGPWSQRGTVIHDLETAHAGKLIVELLSGQASEHFIPWMRAKLSAAPSTGSITIKLYPNVVVG